VLCCGGSWLCPDSVVKEKRWGEITKLAAAAVAGK
jgi:2-dehydro-3-deoxyphosphogluconate aldolase / (4S)-4-hydroxy-2-oxoglutarate aldolase